MEPVTLVDPITKLQVVVDVPVEEYRLRAQGYHEPAPTPEPVAEQDLAEGLALVESAATSGADALRVLQDAAEAAAPADPPEDDAPPAKAKPRK